MAGIFVVIDVTFSGKFSGAGRNIVLTLATGAMMLSGCVGASDDRPAAQVSRPVVYSPNRPVVQTMPPTRPNQTNGSSYAPQGLENVVGAMWKEFPGAAGIAIKRQGSPWVVSRRGNQLMPQQSVSKLWVALTLLDQVDRGQRNLDDNVLITREDLTLFHQPIAAKVNADGSYQTTLRDLLNRAMRQSDNTANDSILRTLGGPNAVNDFIRRKGLGPIRFGPGERLLQARTAGLTWNQSYSQGSNFYKARSSLSYDDRNKALDSYYADPPDGAAPEAVADAMLRLVKGDLLSSSSTSLIMGLMETSETGKQRLRAGVPYGWRFGHKTGTGQDLGSRTVGYNDVGYMIAPDGTAYAVVVMIGSTSDPIAKRQELMQGVSASVAANHQSPY